MKLFISILVIQGLYIRLVIGYDDIWLKSSRQVSVSKQFIIDQEKN